MKGILLDEHNELKVINGTLSIGDSTLQEVGLILGMNKGELKEYPLLGPNLVTFMRSSASSVAIRQRARQHLAMDGKRLEDLEHLIKIKLKRR